jgi:ATP-dependent helicase HrpB
VLPIHDVLPRLREALRSRPRAVLQAPPGAGKTTVVPLALVDEPWAAGQKIVMLEPRRLAARAAARRMAATRGDPVGGLVGFRVRGESAVGARTRVEVVTEGVLTRMLTRDPTLEGVAAVIFDEFHERSLVADTGLALALHTANLVRPDLRVLVMSATLDGAAVAALLGDAPVITAHGRAFPVDVRWVPPRAGVRPVDAVAAAVHKALDETDGDVLVFLPGAGEIRRVGDALGMPSGVRVIPLHGSLPAADQDAAIAPAPVGTRKVVLSTSVAETSLTIEGVRAVVDSGLARVPRFDPRSGMTRLETVRVSQDSAEQRRGRAGRTAPGVCYRLWTEQEHAALLARRTPEMLAADLAPLALDLALAGVQDAGDLAWLDPPPAASLAQARELLRELDVLDAAGAVTAHGRAAARFGLHPRLAHLVVRAGERGAARLGAELAALLADRDVLRDTDDPDIQLRLAALRRDADADPGRVDRGRVHRAREDARRIVGSVQATRSARDDPGARDARTRDTGAHDAATRDADVGELVALAFPDRVALARGGGRFRLRNGRGATVPATSPLAAAPALAIAETDGARDDARVFIAAALDRAAIPVLCARQLTETKTSAFDTTAGTVLTRERRALGALILEERVTRSTDDDEIVAAFADRVRAVGIAAVPLGDAGESVRQRMTFARMIDPAWPDVSDAALLNALDAWFVPAAHGARTWKALDSRDFGAAIRALAGHPLAASLDRVAPTHITVATGSRVPVDYSDPTAPAISVRLQELFGTGENPTVGLGRVRVTVRLLSPAGRPLQVTRDLGGFWSGSYAEVRKEMRGRYPRHEWPEDPLGAAPTRRAKPRR